VSATLCAKSALGTPSTSLIDTSNEGEAVGGTEVVVVVVGVLDVVVVGVLDVVVVVVLVTVAVDVVGVVVLVDVVVGVVDVVA
jgi:hypothetical protein